MIGVDNLTLGTPFNRRLPKRAEAIPVARFGMMVESGGAGSTQQLCPA